MGSDLDVLGWILSQGPPLVLSVSRRTKSDFSFPLSLHPTMKVRKERKKGCVQIKCKGSVKINQINTFSMASPV